MSRRPSRSAPSCATALLLTIFAVAAACSSQGPGADGNSDPIAETDVDRLGSAVEQTEPVDPAGSVVGILAEGCGPSAGSGTGVAVRRPGLIVTVAHTVAGATALTVIDDEGIAAPARIVAFDPNADLAVLDVGDALDIEPLQLAESPPDVGPATMLRWTEADGVEQFDIEVTNRLAIAIDDIYGTRSVERSGIELAALVVVGDSGGPVVTTEASGQATVIGIIYARSQSRPAVAFATDATEVSDVLAGVTGADVDNGTCV